MRTFVQLVDLAAIAALVFIVPFTIHDWQLYVLAVLIGLISACQGYLATGHGKDSCKEKSNG